MSKKNAAVFSEDIAARMLENIFLSCNKEPNTVPLQTLTTYSNYRKERYSLQRTVLLVMLTLFALLPLLFITTGFSIQNTKAGEDPVYYVQPRVKLPVRQVSALINGEPQKVSKLENGGYAIYPERNGPMQITMTLFNLQASTQTVTVTDTTDYEKPQLKSSRRAGNFLMLYLSDNLSGINGMGISVEDSEGNSLSDFRFDTDNNCLTIPYTKEKRHIRIPDYSGNVKDIFLNYPEPENEQVPD